MTKQYLMGTVKAKDVDDDPNGTFEVVLSAPTLDRDGEVIDAKAFEPLPDHITFDIDHGMSVVTTVGSGVPSYDDQGRLVVRGTFSSIPRAQEVRTLVTEGHIRTTSVAFMDATREQGKDGKAHITRAEILNGAFVPIPSNREAVVLSAKAYSEKVGARNSSEDSARLQQMHDLTVETGAKCAGKAAAGAELKFADTMPKDERLQLLELIRPSVEGGSASPWLQTFYDLLSVQPDEEQPEPQDPGEQSSAAPVTPGDEPGKSPASGISYAEYVRIRTA